MAIHIHFITIICLSLIGVTRIFGALQPKESMQPVIKEKETKNSNIDVDMVLAQLLPSSSSSVKKDEIDISLSHTNNSPIANVPKQGDKNKENINLDYDSPQIESGAVIRGVLVFVGISMIFVVYLGFKTCRKKRGNLIVRKYGVRTRRSDVEMRPLPLDDDEEDETIFDVGSLNKP